MDIAPNLGESEGKKIGNEMESGVIMGLCCSNLFFLVCSLVALLLLRS